MTGVYRVFRGTVTLIASAVIAALLLGFALDFFTDADWNPLSAVEMVLGFWPILALLTGLTIGMWSEAFALGRGGFAERAASRRLKRKPLEIVFDPNDHRFVHREFPNGPSNPITRISIGIHNSRGNCPLQDVVVIAKRSAFATSTIAPAWGGVRIRRIDHIAPNHTAFVEILAAPDTPDRSGDGRGKVQRFVIRASGGDTRWTSAKFEFNPSATPMIRRVS